MAGPALPDDFPALDYPRKPGKVLELRAREQTGGAIISATSAGPKARALAAQQAQDDLALARDAPPLAP